jgi:hypothetical protein
MQTHQLQDHTSQHPRRGKWLARVLVILFQSIRRKGLKDAVGVLILSLAVFIR